MAVSRYRPSRTLVRRLCRLPQEDREEFRNKIRRLRDHFERFNSDASEICQWLMGLRKKFIETGPNQSAGFGVLGYFLLEPQFAGIQADDKTRDQWRLHVFDDVAGFRPAAISALPTVPDDLRQAMKEVADKPHSSENNVTSRRLFDRLSIMEPDHRLVLLKSAAEWIVAHYRRGMENWIRGYAEWENEKCEWEKRHPELTKVVRQQYTDVFKSLVWDKEKPPGVRNKRPRICPYDRLRENIDNCIYAGQKGHGPLCWKYVDFVKAQMDRFNRKNFEKDVKKYIVLNPSCARNFGEKPQNKRFNTAWNTYLQTLDITEQNLRSNSLFPHCVKIDGIYEKSKCCWNPHTELCNQYHQKLAQFDDDMLSLEPFYREWRRDYLAGPRKPSFRYPSARDLPMPKIFGAGFHQFDFERSVVRLRLDDMPPGEWIEFGFTHWPRDYRPSRREIANLATSAHVHFVGTRARLGIRFDAPHKTSRFGCSQDELDELRSRKFPRQAQDPDFLKAARKRLLESFDGDPEQELRVFAVDLGETGAAAAAYSGRKQDNVESLHIIKINFLYPKTPQELKRDCHNRPDKTQLDKDDPRGLGKRHVARHLERIREKTSKLVEVRAKYNDTAASVAGDRDLIGLKRHVAWMIRDWARHNAAQIVALAEKHQCDLVVFESLRGFRLPDYDKMDLDKKRRLAMFAFGRIRRKVTEKAVERGMRVITLPYYKSSQVCWACGHVVKDQKAWRKKKNKGNFKCQCGASADGMDTSQRCPCRETINSDVNAACVLARVFWGEIELPQPEGHETKSR